ncbi:MAG: hypothetical protein R3C56_30495 [Pirellulaceae bacterium]
MLSVQVHPDDHYGQQMLPPDLGKTEAWYIIAEPESVLYAGSKLGVTREDLQAALQRAKSSSVSASYPPSSGRLRVHTSRNRTRARCCRTAGRRDPASLQYHVSFVRLESALTPTASLVHYMSSSPLEVIDFAVF